MLTREQYETERAIVDKAEATLRALWPSWEKGGAIPEDVVTHPDYAACNNAMRGRVEQYELIHHTPETFVAYIGADNSTATTWAGDVIGDAKETSRWATPRSYIGTTMRQYHARVGGREFTGRGFGEGMCIVFRETAASKRKRSA